MTTGLGVKSPPTLTAPPGFKYFDHNPATGVHEWFRFDEMTGEISIASSQDPTAIIEANKAEAYTAKGKIARKGQWGVKAASIPMTLIYKWLNEEGWNALDPNCGDKLAQKLNSNEYAYLRCAEFRM